MGMHDKMASLAYMDDVKMSGFCDDRHLTFRAGGRDVRLGQVRPVN